MQILIRFFFKYLRAICKWIEVILHLEKGISLKYKAVKITNVTILQLVQ